MSNSLWKASINSMLAKLEDGREPYTRDEIRGQLDLQQFEKYWRDQFAFEDEDRSIHENAVKMGLPAEVLAYLRNVADLRKLKGKFDGYAKRQDEVRARRDNMVESCLKTSFDMYEELTEHEKDFLELPGERLLAAWKQANPMLDQSDFEKRKFDKLHRLPALLPSPRIGNRNRQQPLVRAQIQALKQALAAEEDETTPPVPNSDGSA